MKIVQINATCGVGSTGKICKGISQMLSLNSSNNHIIYSCFSDGYELGIKCSSKGYLKFQAFKAKLFGNFGLNSSKATVNIIRELEKFSPDIVHLHNIHGHDCDIEILFKYFKKNNIKLVWTFHDCWAFTGYCVYFDLINCDKWKQMCSQCPQAKSYSWLFDRCGEMFVIKKQLFSDLDLTIVTPSVWLSNNVKKSFLNNYPVHVINNGIDISCFKYIKSNFREKYGLCNKKVVLGVALGWEHRKGLDVFIELSKKLPDDYKIILIGTNDKIDKVLPNNIISIHRTHDQRELAAIYSAADVFVNPTREENYPTVNMEAIACGTPVVTFRTGGAAEMLDETCGSVVDCDDLVSLESEIIRICTDKPFTREACLKKAKEFDKNERFKEYMKLYERIISAGT